MYLCQLAANVGKTELASHCITDSYFRIVRSDKHKNTIVSKISSNSCTQANYQTATGNQGARTRWPLNCV